MASSTMQDTVYDEQAKRAERIASVKIPSGVETLMDREPLDARIEWLRRNYNSYNKTMVAELKRLVAEQAARDLDKMGVPR